MPAPQPGCASLRLVGSQPGSMGCIAFTLLALATYKAADSAAEHGRWALGREPHGCPRRLDGRPAAYIRRHAERPAAAASSSSVARPACGAIRTCARLAGPDRSNALAGITLIGTGLWLL